MCPSLPGPHGTKLGIPGCGSKALAEASDTAATAHVDLQLQLRPSVCLPSFKFPHVTLFRGSVKSLEIISALPEVCFPNRHVSRFVHHTASRYGCHHVSTFAQHNVSSFGCLLVSGFLQHYVSRFVHHKVFRFGCHPVSMLLHRCVSRFVHNKLAGIPFVQRHEKLHEGMHDSDKP